MFASIAHNPFTAFEAVLLVLALALAWAWPQLGVRGLARLEAGLAAIARRPALAMFTPALLLIAARLVLLPIMPWPPTVGRDESSLRLLAETMLMGRMANPPHPFAPFFESVYVNQWPAYASMYFPGRGLEIALGLALAGEPSVGVMLVLALAAAAMVWMLRGWLSPGLALVGGLVFVLQFGLFSPYMNQPAGLVLPLVGGALVVGALPRLGAAMPLAASVPLAAGVAILATTRPFEGLMFCLPVALWLLWRLPGLARHSPRAALRLVLPALLAVSAALGWLALHDHATTGDALQAPFAKNRIEHAGTPAFVFQPPTTPTRALPAHLAGYYALEGRALAQYATPLGATKASLGKIVVIWATYAGLLLTLPLILGLGWLGGQRLLLAALAAILTGFMLVQFSWPHYLAPAASALLLLVMAGLARLRRLGARGLLLSRALPLALLASLALPLASLAGLAPPLAPTVRQACCYLPLPYGRDAVAARIAAQPGRHLVFVHALPGASGWQQWVFNGPDIDGQQLIWAHDLGSARNAALIAYYPDRRVWRVTGLARPRLAPYRSGPHQGIVSPR